MPLKTEMERDQGGGGGGSFPPEIFRPLPDKAGLSISNKVVIPLFSPALWALFNPTQEMAQKYRMIFNNGGLISIPQDLMTFYLKVPCHRIDDFQRRDGTSGFSYVVCPHKMNNYLQKVLEYGPMFEDGKCAYCEEEQKFWKVFNDRFEAMDYDEEARKKLSKEEYRRIVESDPVLKQARGTAKNHSASDRYVLSMFDFAKFIGERPMEEDQTGVEHQFWMSPRTVFEKLAKIYEAGHEFFDTSTTDIQIVSIVKDTTKCSGRDMMRTEYDAVAGVKHTFDEAWRAYINNTQAMVDPSRFINLASYEEMKYYLGGDNQQQTQGNLPPQQQQQQGGPPPQTQGNLPPQQQMQQGGPPPQQQQQQTPPQDQSPVPPQGQQQGGPPPQTQGNLPPQQQTQQGGPPPQQQQTGGPMPSPPGGGNPPNMSPPGTQTQGNPPPHGTPPDRNPPPGSPPSGRRKW